MTNSIWEHIDFNILSIIAASVLAVLNLSSANVERKGGKRLINFLILAFILVSGVVEFKKSTSDKNDLLAKDQKIDSLNFNLYVARNELKEAKEQLSERIQQNFDQEQTLNELRRYELKDIQFMFVFDSNYHKRKNPVEKLLFDNFFKKNKNYHAQFSFKMMQEDVDFYYRPDSGTSACFERIEYLSPVYGYIPIEYDAEAYVFNREFSPEDNRRIIFSFQKRSEPERRKDSTINAANIFRMVVDHKPFFEFKLFFPEKISSSDEERILESLRSIKSRFHKMFLYCILDYGTSLCLKASLKADFDLKEDHEFQQRYYSVIWRFTGKSEIEKFHMLDL